jgi:beta-glucosidase
MNYELLTKTLKEEWGFKGFTVSDWEDFELLHAVHQTASDSYDAIIKAINAGVDMSMVPYSPQYKNYCSLFVKAVKEGKISESRLNDAVRRILRVKYLVGLFKKDRNQASDYNKFGSDEFKKIAENAALESITLLKNDKDILPLSTDKKVLIAGATSNDLIFLNGAWTHTWQGADNRFNTKGCKTIRAAFEEKLGKDNCIFTQACELYLENGFEKSKLNDKDKFIAEAAKVDVIVLCLGEFPATEKPGDIFSLNLSSEQLELAKIAYTTGKPVILVLTEARPRIIREIEEKASAIISCYLPGDYGADALVRLIYGETDFSGRLPFTYPRYDGVIEFYDHPKSVDKAKSGVFDAYNPQWNFGFGLSYNKVDYSELQLSKSSINTADSLKISVNIKNTGKNSTREVVQLYLSDLQASIVPAGKKLVDFKKIELKAGEQKTVDFTITQNSLKFADTGGNFVTEKGKFKVSIGKLFAEFNLE